MDQLGIDFEARETEYVAKWKKATEKAIKTSGENANEAWKAAVYGVLQQIARENETFATYQVVDRAVATIPQKTHDWRAIGAVIRQGLADRVMETIPGKSANNPNRHGAMAPVYRSLIFKQDRLQSLLQAAYERMVQ